MLTLVEKSDKLIITTHQKSEKYFENLNKNIFKKFFKKVLTFKIQSVILSKLSVETAKSTLKNKQ